MRSDADLDADTELDSHGDADCTPLHLHPHLPPLTERLMLDDNDLDRITDKLKIAVLDVMKEHMETVHEKLYERINRLERAITFWRGAMFVFGGIFAFVLALVERSH